ncbi:NADH dehydrogenase subunit K [Candidatus Kryptonium thompsonii]|jgi:NADH-quinone oxidoreductase subunit K|uniref:NADH-quinone oxidoreductase subunit K n=1 Tax=Candidatus Kryptonium thompsonii TaxID=1633631 RepID=A0A0P1L9I1_9BACT|nr:NADH-quinone oxidoreductase subunit NuoK [Candidatus Kryptonium thompsoni]CUS77834.1 NADH dehydrogenase subunit K [Candidatus Kryptonium thompsoni]CUS78747.1 NADH dehydrogenase subunit K [Candidatus Kryptonium thompsoni]CUS80689.1 NADH dehydrogenase subunit K [Candidatus Kryptonium thompsoni]CUS85594.1 NADH dehydrogenase subunit K [Candidatus Kryptonium thompsoni]CUS85643.1 NADH dehydrogenase subunit K [Candidatus Kryptonium thompsoni]
MLVNLSGLKSVGLEHFLIIGAILFSLGIYAVVTRKNAIMVLMGIELILNSANINFIAFSKYSTADLSGHLAAIFVIILAAAEAAIAIAIVLNIYKNFLTINIDEIDNLKR